MASRVFVDYPAAKEATDLSYTWQEDKNPVLRGLPLVAASALVTNVGFVSRFIWRNTGFDKLKNIPDLGKEVATLKPRVTPIAPSYASSLLSPSASPAAGESGHGSSIVTFGPELQEPQYTAHDGRFYSAADYHALYRSGAATPRDVVEALLPLVQRGLGSPYETAFLVSHVDEVRQAAAESTARWAAGQPLGLLDGVPFSVKCDISVAGYVSTIGMDTHPDDDAFGRRYPRLRTPQEETAWPVRKLLEAGALLVAQNNMHELGMDTTGCNPFMGTPVNWYNPSYYPGGSSSGAGSALGAGLIPIALGTDAGGSVRIPPSFNGVYGLKTTHDRVVVMDSSMCVVGPMAGSVADLTAAYRIMSQPNADDPVQGRFAVSVPAPAPAPKGSSGSSGSSGSTPRVIGVPRAWVQRSDPVVLEHFERMVAYLASEHGYEVVDIELPLLSQGQSAHALTCLSEALSAARDRTSPADPDGWAALINWQNRILLSTAQHASAVDLLKAGQLRTVLMRHLAHLFDKHPGLVIATPATPMAGWKIHPGDQRLGFTDGNMSLLAMRYVWLANTTGCPSVSCPMGYAEPEQGRGRVPMGILVTGQWGAEEQLLAWAGLAEKYLYEVYPGSRPRPDKWVDVLSLARDKAGEAVSSDGAKDGSSDRVEDSRKPTAS